ncbi:MAG: cytochrome c biogenesis protein ResB, partial [Deltaproteobacteria bacterium]|nr:cytochrome c biogenesis protein ResB [Deltaproteobacteria bacterium]
TGLMVTRNPGLAVFWLGCALGGVGLFLAFFMPHKRILVHVINDQITVGYSDSRAGDVPKREADRWVEELKGRTS